MTCLELKPTVRIADCRQIDGKAKVQLGFLRETGSVLTGPLYLPELLRLLDGRRTLEEIGDLLRAKGFSASGPEVAALAGELQRRGFVQPVSAPPDDNRYYKHLLFFGLFGDSAAAARQQASLKDKSIALIGMGGIGSALAYLLGAAGVGRLRGVDPDSIELSNLTRQVLYRTADVGRLKVEAAAERLKEYNPGVDFDAWPRAVASAADLEKAVAGCDLAILSADSPSALIGWMNQASLKTKVPFLSSGYTGHAAVCGPLVIPGRTACLRCAGEPSSPSFSPEAVAEVNGRHAVPSFGPINHLSASLAAAEALKFLAGFAEPLTLGARYVFDPLRFEGRRIAVERNPTCRACADVR